VFLAPLNPFLDDLSSLEVHTFSVGGEFDVDCLWLTKKSETDAATKLIVNDNGPLGLRRIPGLFGWGELPLSSC
jgi:hypothetical protein